MQVHRLVLQRPPQPLNEDVVEIAAAAVHGAACASRAYPVGERDAGKLGTLVRVEYLRRAGMQRRLERVDAESAVHRVRQPPRQDMAAGPVHHSDEIEKAIRNRDIGDVRTPRLVRLIDHQVAPHPVPTGDHALAAQMAHHLPAGRETPCAQGWPRWCAACGRSPPLSSGASAAAPGADRRPRPRGANGAPSADCQVLALPRRTDAQGATRQAIASVPGSPSSRPTARSTETTGSRRAVGTGEPSRVTVRARGRPSRPAPTGSARQPAQKKIPLHRQLADLGVQFPDLRFVSRLIGERLLIHLHHDRLRAFLGADLVVTLARVHARGQQRLRQVDYHHVIHALAAKPQAFRYSRLRDDLLPNDRYRQLWRTVDEQLAARDACKWMVGVLRLAADYDCERALMDYLEAMLATGPVPTLKHLQARYLPQQPVVNVNVEQHDLEAYDQLLATPDVTVTEVRSHV